MKKEGAIFNENVKIIFAGNIGWVCIKSSQYVTTKVGTEGKQSKTSKEATRTCS
jgi:hypothetical protein